MTERWRSPRLSNASKGSVEGVTHRPWHFRATKRVGRRKRLSLERSLRHPETALLNEGKRAEIKA
jgi:hypothetical protein